MKWLLRMTALMTLATLIATSIASGLQGTYKAKVVWIGKSIPSPLQRAQIQRLEEHMRLVLLPSQRYLLADNKGVFEGIWQSSNGQLILIPKPSTSGGATRRVVYELSKDFKSVVPKVREAPSYIGFIKSSNSTKL